jgi:hypothetical protein
VKLRPTNRSDTRTRVELLQGTCRPRTQFWRLSGGLSFHRWNLGSLFRLHALFRAFVLS